MKVLFIAYYFDPFPGVGAKRLSYWAKNIHLHYAEETDFKATVITATEQISPLYDHNLDINYVPDIGGGTLSHIFKTDKGASWLRNLTRFLRDHLVTHTYDVAVITGGPFLHFFILKFLKTKGIKVILDFRDPFASNPRSSKTTSLLQSCKRHVMKLIERYFITNADKVIAVNKYCIDLLSGLYVDRKRFVVIDNGYDETQFGPQISGYTPDNKGVKLAYAGTFYKGKGPSVFLKELVNKKDFKFYHIGAKSKFLTVLKSPNIFELGILPYNETLQELQRCDVGMIFTSGAPFESTTKIFDYIGLGKFIWIITEGEIRTGAIHDITKNYPNVLWSKNNSNDISAVLLKLSNNFKIEDFPEKNIYSRAHGLMKLVEELNSLKS